MTALTRQSGVSFLGLIMALTLCCGTPPPATAALAPNATSVAPKNTVNLLVNANFALGAGARPDHWSTEAWINGPAATRYAWKRPAGAPNELEVTNMRPNDARWLQQLVLLPGWYHVTTETRTENVGLTAQGATVSLLEDGINSPDVRGTSGWRRIGFYLKVGSRGADVEIALRLGGFSSLNTGRAFFRDPSVTRVAAPPVGAPAVFDLEAIRKASASHPIGRPASLIAVFLALAALAFYGWRLFGTPVSAHGVSRAARARGEQPKGEGGRNGSLTHGRRGKRGSSRHKTKP